MKWQDVRFWRLADMPTSGADVRFWGVKRTLPKRPPMPAFDPKRTSASQSIISSARDLDRRGLRIVAMIC